MLEIRLLGTLDVWRDGTPVVVRGARQRTVLAALALQAPAVVPGDRLVDLVWGVRPPADPANALQWLVAQLRRHLGPDAVVTRAPGYALAARWERIDIRRFEHLLDEGRELQASDPVRAERLLRAALQLWRGSPLGDVADDERFAGEARRLEELRLLAEELLLELHLRLGRASDVVVEVERLVHEHPYRERLHALRMRALYAAGRQADALIAFREARAALDEALGVEPGRELRDLERSILLQDVDAGEPAQAGVPGGSPAATGLPSIVLAGATVAEIAGLAHSIASLAVSRLAHELVLACLLPAADGADALQQATAALAERRAALGESGVEARVAAFTSTDLAEDALRLAADPRVDLAVLTAPEVDGERPLPSAIERILREAPCDVALVRSAAAPAAGSDAPVVVAFAGGPHDWASLELAAWLASAEARPLVVAGTAADRASGRRDASRALGVASLAVQQLVGVVAQPLLVPASPAALADAAADARLLVLPFPERWDGGAIGAFRAAVVASCAAQLMLVHAGSRTARLAPVDGATRFSWTP